MMAVATECRLKAACDHDFAVCICLNMRDTDKLNTRLRSLFKPRIYTALRTELTVPLRA